MAFTGDRDGIFNRRLLAQPSAFYASHGFRWLCWVTKLGTSWDGNDGDWPSKGLMISGDTGGRITSLIATIAQQRDGAP